jgi:hypothetical protein
MAGSPVRRAKRAVEDAARALQEGREDDAKRALAELRRTLNETGVDLPEMPREIAELWLTITDAKPKARKAHLDGTALMSEDARAKLLEAGEIAAQRLLEMLSDERLFGYAGLLTFDQQQSWVNLALQRGFGGMAAGAQRLALPSDEDAPRQAAIGSTLRLLVRAKQEARDEAESEVDLDLVDGSAKWEEGPHEKSTHAHARDD